MTFPKLIVKNPTAWRMRWFRSLATFILVSLLTFTLIITWGTMGRSQVLIDPKLNNFLQSQGIHVYQGEERLGNLVYAPVKLDGEIVLLVAAQNSLSKDEHKEMSPIEQRVHNIESKLKGIVQRGFDPQTLQVTSAILNGETVILVSDQKNLQPQPVLTITELDAQLYGLPVPELAQGAAKYLYTILLQAQEERQPEYLFHQSLKAGGVFLGAIIIASLLLILQKYLISRRLALIQVLKGILTDLPPPSTEESPDLEPKLQEESIKKRLKLNTLLERLLLFGQIFLCVAGISVILRLFPYTRGLGSWLLGKPSQLLLIWLGVLLVNRGGDILIDWSFREWKEIIQTQLQFNMASERDLLRISTLTGALKGIGAFILISIGFIISLQSLSIPITPVLAGAGILGFAISFGSQNLIKNIITGAMNLLIDSYAVGDWVIIGDVSGSVEQMNLFFTQIRGSTGDLITIPNGIVGIVHNQSKDWSQVNLTIQVSYGTDVDEALTVINDVAQQLYGDSQWQQYI
ncbi:MAG: mechanosensitive ion channel family protein, partial [Microcystaceae cyanobacterium]